MQLQFTEESFKERTKLMLAYFREQGVDIPLSMGYEAVSRFCGAKSWNVISAAFKQEVHHAQLSKLTPTYLLGNARVAAEITASFHTDNHLYETEFDACSFFKDADFDYLVNLALEDWGYCEEADAIARHYEDNVPMLQEALQYLRRLKGHEEECGFEVQVDENEVLKYYRAFDYVLFVKLSIFMHFNVSSFGQSHPYGVFKQGRDWHIVFRNNMTHEPYTSETAAWRALGRRLEEHSGLHWGPGVLDVVPDSGKWE